MRFDPPLQQGQFLRRYKRFFVDVALSDGTTVTAHCPNTGSLAGCLVEGAPVLIQPVDNPARKLRYTWKFIELAGSLVGVDTSISNALVGQAIEEGALPALGGFDRITPEVRYGRDGRSRIDLLLSRGGEARGRGRRPEYVGDERIYVEVKNTTLTLGQAEERVAAFPDAVTERGLKHLDELRYVVGLGHRAAMVFSVQRDDCVAFVPAAHIDPAYAEGLLAAQRDGVEIYALSAQVSPQEVRLTRALPIRL